MLEKTLSGFPEVFFWVVHCFLTCYGTLKPVRILEGIAVLHKYLCAFLRLSEKHREFHPVFIMLSKVTVDLSL